MITIFRRELSAFFKSPVAYCVIGFFMVLTGLYFWMFNIVQRSVDFATTLSSLTTFLVFLAPVLTMKLLAEEKRNGTEVLLRTSPVSLWQVVLGKYLASFVVFLVMVGLSLVYPLIISFLVTTGETGTIPAATITGGYIAFILLGASFLSVGLFASALTENQIVAAVSGIVVLLCMWLIQSIGDVVGGTLGKILMWISLLSRYNDFAVGEFNIASLFFYLSFTGIMLFLTIMHMERKRWN